MLPVGMPKRSWRQRFVILLLTVIMLPVPLLQGAPLMTDAGLRVALLFNFMRFTEWPSDALGSDGAPLTVCIARGDAEMREGLMVLEQRTIKERPIVIQQIRDPRDVGDCHVLYLPEAERRRVSDFLEATGIGRILTVSDGARFIDASGMIGLKLVGNRYQFEVNNDAVRRAKLRLHPQLLSLASRVLQDDN